MNDLNMQIVREFFELRLYHVLTHWQHEEAGGRGADPGTLLFVEPQHTEHDPLPNFLLTHEDLSHIPRCVVDIRAWHGDRFYPSVVESNPVLGRVASEETHQLAQEIFSTDEFTTLLVISELPQSHDPRMRALACLQDLGLDHVIEFPTLLSDMVQRINPHGQYTASPTLQLLRLLKRYDFIRRQQMEFPFPVEAPTTTITPAIETTDLAPEPDDED